MSLTRSLAGELGNCDIVPIAKAIKKDTFEVNSNYVGFVFPVFAWGMPRIVEEFIQKINISKDSFVFAIVTCVAIPGNTLNEVKKLLKTKGIRLQAGFVTKAGRSSLMKLNALDKVIMHLDTRRTKIKFFDERLPELVQNIKNKVQKSPETSNWAANLFGSMFHKMGLSAFKTMDAQFIVADDCSQCGTCAKICPRNNIELLANGPSFKHNCELCHACIQWCPKFAIRHANFDEDPKQYRNNAVKFQDLILNA
ncbi:MAG: 4Fe-4S binding protein [Bacteroidetes bacterium]|nr:4Fe-4S binding protein [Bacteroidota bacterium]